MTTKPTHLGLRPANQELAAVAHGQTLTAYIKELVQDDRHEDLSWRGDEVLIGGFLPPTGLKKDPREDVGYKEHLATLRNTTETPGVLKLHRTPHSFRIHDPGRVGGVCWCCAVRCG